MLFIPLLNWVITTNVWLVWLEPEFCAGTSHYHLQPWIAKVQKIYGQLYECLDTFILKYTPRWHMLHPFKHVIRHATSPSSGGGQYRSSNPSPTYAPNFEWIVLASDWIQWVKRDSCTDTTQKEIQPCAEMTLIHWFCGPKSTSIYVVIKYILTEYVLHFRCDHKLRALNSST